MRALKLCVAVIPDENFESRRTLAEGSHMYCIRKGKVPIGCRILYGCIMFSSIYKGHYLSTLNKMNPETTVDEIVLALHCFE